MKNKNLAILPMTFLFLVGCVSAPLPSPTAIKFPPAETQSPTLPPPTQVPPSLIPASATPVRLVPNFKHIAIVMFENKEFGSVIGNPQMPNYNKLAREYTLLTQYYAVTHPSLPNYIAFISGDTYGIDRDCNNCFIDAPSLPDLIEASGRTWKTYQEDMPEPCYPGDTNIYVQKHNPFMYFDPIRLDSERCRRSIQPLTTLRTDIDAGTLPDYLFIKPNLCNDSHDCALNVSDAWLTNLLVQLVPALDATGESYLLVMMFEEGQGNHSCCGLPLEAGGRVAVVLYSPQVKNGFEDSTPYTHYSMLKTISEAWGLPYLGHASEGSHVLIVEPWK